MAERLHEKVYKDLFYKIRSGHYRAGDVLPTEFELCEIYNVSRITVRTALEHLKTNNLISRSKKRGSIVLPMQNERFFLNRIDMTIAVVFSYFDNYNTEILNGIKTYAQSKNCYIAFYNSDHLVDNEKEILESLLEQKIAGLIIMPVSPYANIGIMTKFAVKKIPFVFLDYAILGCDAPCVASNNFKAAYEITNYLISRNHSNIAYYQFCTEMFSSEQERFKGFCKALTDNNIPFDENMLLYGQKNRLLSKVVPQASFIGEPEKAAIAVEKMIAMNNHPTAVFCHNDYSATYLIDACKQRGIHIPEQLAITGFDNTESSRVYKLTTVAQNWGALSKTAIELLYYKIIGKPLPTPPKIDAFIVERSSVIRREKMLDY